MFTVSAASGGRQRREFCLRDSGWQRSTVPGQPSCPSMRRTSRLCVVSYRGQATYAVMIKPGEEITRRGLLLAREAGETFEDIGRAAGLSRQRVQQIIKSEKP
jgi:hypothetical protein